tara:strand:+ start:118 stop:540 length:423 start_codon:yes stop_codon:yes gene_type:complete
MALSQAMMPDTEYLLQESFEKGYRADLVDFARHNREVSRIYEGTMPEQEGSKWFFVCTPNGMNDEHLLRPIYQLEMRINEHSYRDITVGLWPDRFADTEQSPWLGEQIWTRENGILVKRNFHKDFLEEIQEDLSLRILQE